jgi:hypothetical protein
MWKGRPVTGRKMLKESQGAKAQKEGQELSLMAI